MKKKTLISIIILLVFVSASIFTLKLIHYNIGKKKQGLYDEKISYFIDNVKRYKEDKVLDDSIIVKLTLKDLKDNGYILNNEVNPLNNEEFSDDLTFCIINDNGEYNYVLDDGINCGETIISYENTPKEAYNGYLYSETLYIDFSNLEGLEYYIKSMRDAVTNTNISYSCGKEKMPLECKGFRSTKNIKANTWYKVSGDIEITYDEHSDETSFVYAMVTDNINYVDVKSEVVDKIDRTSPVVVLDSPVSTTNSISVKVKDILDNETGIASSVCRYGTVEDEYTTISMSNTRGKLSKCSINYKLKDKVYYYQVCATDEVGNVGCASGSSLIESIESPISTYNEDGVDINFGNKKNKNLKFYIKATEDISIDSDTISYCNKDNFPTDCIASKTSILKANIWYEVSNKISVSYDSSNSGIIYALIYSEDEYAKGSIIAIK